MGCNHECQQTRKGKKKKIGPSSNPIEFIETGTGGGGNCGGM